MNPKPARLRPALPQDWVQAVDERAADSGTPTSARSTPAVATFDTRQQSTADDSPAQEAGTKPRPALPQDWVQAVEERAADSGTPTSARSTPAVATFNNTGARQQSTADGSSPTPAEAQEPLDTAAPEQAPQPDTTSLEAEAGQADGGAAAHAQAVPSKDAEGGQQAAPGGLIPPTIPESKTAPPPQPVGLEAVPQMAPTGAVPPPEALLSARSHADAVHAGPAEVVNQSQPALRSPDKGVRDASSGAGRSRPGFEQSYSKYPQQVAVPASPQREAYGSYTTEPAAAIKAPDSQPEGNMSAAAGGAAGAADTGRLMTAAPVASSRASPVPSQTVRASLEAMIPPPFETGSPDQSPSHMQSQQTSAPLRSAFQNNQASTGHPQPEADPRTIVVEDTGSGMAPGSSSWAQAAEGDSSGYGYAHLQGRQLERPDSPEVHRRIDRAAVEVQQVVAERGQGQIFGGGPQEGPRTSDALARATGTLKALVAGHVEEADSLSRSLPVHSGELV